MSGFNFLPTPPHWEKFTNFINLQTDGSCYSNPKIAVQHLDFIDVVRKNMKEAQFTLEEETNWIELVLPFPGWNKWYKSPEEMFAAAEKWLDEQDTSEAMNEQEFCRACDGKFTPEGEDGRSPSSEMLEFALSINPKEAKRLADLPSINWDEEPIAQELIAKGFGSRQIQAVLEAAASRETDDSPDNTSKEKPVPATLKAICYRNKGNHAYLRKVSIEGGKIKGNTFHNPDKFEDQERRHKGKSVDCWFDLGKIEDGYYILREGAHSSSKQYFRYLVILNGEISKEFETESEMIDHAAKIAEQNWPPLEGSPKQVAWAISLRRMAFLGNLPADFSDPSAKYWIDTLKDGGWINP